MRVAIDSSNKLTYTGIMSGSFTATEELFQNFERIFKENGVAGKFHWSQLSSKMKNKLKVPLAKALSESKMNFNVIYHRKPAKVTKKEWFMFYLPTQIAQRLEHWLSGRGGNVELIVDDDYTVIKGGTGTVYFIERLLRQLSVRLTGKEATVRREDKMKMTVKQANGNILSFHASVAGKSSRGIGLVDVYLGLYIFEPRLFREMKNVYYKSLK